MAYYGYPIINKIIGFMPNNYMEIGIFSGEGIKDMALNHKYKNICEHAVVSSSSTTFKFYFIN